MGSVCHGTKAMVSVQRSTSPEICKICVHCIIPDRLGGLGNHISESLGAQDSRVGRRLANVVWNGDIRLGSRAYGRLLNFEFCQWLSKPSPLQTRLFLKQRVAWA